MAVCCQLHLRLGAKFCKPRVVVPKLCIDLVARLAGRQNVGDVSHVSRGAPCLCSGTVLLNGAIRQLSSLCIPICTKTLRHDLHSVGLKTKGKSERI